MLTVIVIIVDTDSSRSFQLCIDRGHSLVNLRRGEQGTTDFESFLRDTDFKNGDWTLLVSLFSGPMLVIGQSRHWIQSRELELSLLNLFYSDLKDVFSTHIHHTSSWDEMRELACCCQLPVLRQWVLLGLAHQNVLGRKDGYFQLPIPGPGPRWHPSMGFCQLSPTCTFPFMILFCILSS